MTDERLNLPSASSFAADVLCHGRRNLIRSMFAQGVPDLDNETPSIYAARGTRIHRALELDQAFELAEDEAEAYRVAVKIKATCIDIWCEDNGIESFTEMPRESRFWLNHRDTLAPMLSGQLDAHWVSEDQRHICIIDFKTGRADYMEQASLNWQLRCAALLTWIEYGRKAERIRVALVKPETQGEPLDYCDFTRFDLEQIEAATNLILWQTQQPDAPRTAGEHCKYCAAKAVCHEALRMALTPVNTLQIVPSSNGKLTKKYVAQLVETAPIESVREVFGKRGIVKFVMEAVVGRLAALPEEEKYRLGLKMQLGRSTDYIRDTKAAFDVLLAWGFPESEIWSCLSFSKSEIVEMVKRFRNCRDSEGDVFYEVTLDDFIERGRGNEILAEA